MRILDWQTGGRDELVEFIRARLVAGFWDYGDLLEWVRQWVEDSGVVDPEEANGLLRSMWNDRLVEQSQWQDTGDFGLLQYTFAQLESEGILARMCFACCTNCATVEIDDERTLDPDPSDWYRYRQWAYTYFHEQDALRLAEPEPKLLLGYSAFRAHPSLPPALVRAYQDGDKAATKEVAERTETMVGRRIVQLANHFGLSTSWSGSLHSRIELRISHWRKPLPQRD